MLDANMKQQLSVHFQNLKNPVEIVTFTDESVKGKELTALASDLAGLHDKITVITGKDASERVPSIAIRAAGTDARVRFAGIPMGHEFTSLILAILQAGGHDPKIEQELIEQIKGLDTDLNFETFISLSCQNCPEVVQALNLLAVLNPRVKNTMIDGALFQDEVDTRQVMAVPTVFLNGANFAQGRMSIKDIVRKIDSNASKREAAAINTKAPFDTLIIGGGPAGAAASIYTARKGIRTGIVAERFGGQIMDTMAIENFISVKTTEGPKLAASLEQHVLEYNVDLMTGHRAKTLIPAKTPGGLIEVELENGAKLASRSVIISTGARWREMNVPGEQEYRNRGVAYCPHCDGPLFKGKPVAVIGGGNSGVEAAIDLAGIVAKVTLLEFGAQLRADDVLQRKLRSLSNVEIITNAMTTEVIGNGEKVTGLIYQNRESSVTQPVELDGIFVQIGLIPNSEWLQDTLELTEWGEVITDERGQTSLPGVFAAGDVTIAPYKQIIIAMGSGANAALGTFDYLIRTDVPQSKEDVAA